MTFDELKKRVGKNIKYYDETDGWVTSRDVTENDIGDYINEVYREDLFPLYASRWPHVFRHTGYLNSWLMSATVNAASTGTTLIIDSDDDTAFANIMEGLRVYNETDDEYAYIETYTDTDEVTLDTTIGDTWDGDTIYILGQEFAFGGDATDYISIERIKVKYDSDDDYVFAELRDKQDLFQRFEEQADPGDEGSELTPYVYLTGIQDSGNMYQGIGVFPRFTEKVSKAIEMDYIAKPGEMTGSADTPVIPFSQSLICGATMKAYEKKQDMERARYWQGKYELAMKKDISRYRPLTTNVPVDMKITRSAYHIHRRNI